MKRRERIRKRIALFGNFDSTNFGNESTLQTILYHLPRFVPDADVTCISTGPEATVANHHIKAIPISETFVKSWVPKTSVTRALRKIGVGLPSEPYRWISAFVSLRRTDVLIIPGTGLLTDAYGIFHWGPYNLLKWSLIAKVCRCKLFLVSVGAGPVYGTFGKYFVRLVLSLADFRSYRDNSSKRDLQSIGFHADKDRVYPDLVFSLPEAAIPNQKTTNSRRSIVGLGLMAYAGMYGVSRPDNDSYLAYLKNLVNFVMWLLANEYDVRLLIGDVGDRRVAQDFRSLLRERLSACDCDEERIIDEPISSVEELLSQIVATDIVVGTRFHNVLLSLLCNKPVIAISFHHKCESLMSSVGLSAYCLDINDLATDRLIEKFRDLETKAGEVKPLIGKRVGEFRKALDEQYNLIFNDI
jgi:polysaccharide pyruvyl transferase WcaK-like protein